MLYISAPSFYYTFEDLQHLYPYLTTWSPMPPPRPTFCRFETLHNFFLSGKFFVERKKGEGRHCMMGGNNIQLNISDLPASHAAAASTVHSKALSVSDNFPLPGRKSYHWTFRILYPAWCHFLSI